MNFQSVDPGEHHTTLRGVRFWYLVRGEGPLLLLQPGGAGWGGDITPYAQGLHRLEEFRTVIYLEPRGHGRSGRSSEENAYRLDEYVHDIEAMRNHLGQQSIELAGHSHGGFVAMKYAITYPERVKRLLLWGTTPCLSLGDQPEWMSKRAGSVQAQEDLKRVSEDGSLTPQERHRAFLRILVPIVHFHNPAIAASTLVPLIDQMTISVEPYSYWQANEKQAYDIRGDLGRIIAPHKSWQAAMRCRRLR